MKNITLAIMLFLLSTTLFAQKDVTQFLGIPVDGSKTDMIQKLKAKGFTSSSLDRDILQGTFNGTDVNLYVVTNGTKVSRIMVADANKSTEIDIRIRFNLLCSQFQVNTRCLTASGQDYRLPDDEKISIGMTIKKKRYEASFMQLPALMDTVAFQNEIRLRVLSKYTEDEISNASEELMNEMAATIAVSYMIEKYSKKSVWFMINEYLGEYYITLFYDNKYNMANGEDL